MIVYFDTDMYSVSSPGAGGNDDDGKACDDEGGSAIFVIVKTDLDGDKSTNCKNVYSMYKFMYTVS